MRVGRHRTVTATIIAACVLSAWTLVTAAAATQDQPCLHGDDETPGERARRRAAVLFLRAVNTAQARARGSAGSYQMLTDLPDLPPMPDGFTAILAADVDVYAAALKDTRDPCRYALFSDQTGLIYSGRPIQ
jgi:hypothetical protein